VGAVGRGGCGAGVNIVACGRTEVSEAWRLEASRWRRPGRGEWGAGRAFDLTPDVSVKQIGLGLAAAVLADATVVRLVLVPAVMELLGRANWWLPGWPTSPEPPNEPGSRRCIVREPGLVRLEGVRHA
jgi:hypothetical protein